MYFAAIMAEADFCQEEPKMARYREKLRWVRLDNAAKI